MLSIDENISKLQLVEMQTLADLGLESPEKAAKVFALEMMRVVIEHVAYLHNLDFDHLEIHYYRSLDIPTLDLAIIAIKRYPFNDLIHEVAQLDEIFYMLDNYEVRIEDEKK